MRTIAVLLLAVVFAFSLPDGVGAEEVRVYIGVGIVVGGLSVFVAFALGSRHSSDRRREREMAARDGHALSGLESCRLEYKAPLPPIHGEPGMLTVLRW